MVQISYPSGVRLTETHTSPEFAVGTRAEGSDGSKWVYVKAASAITLGYWVAIDSTYAAAAPLTKANAILGYEIGWASQAAIAASSYGWVQTKGLGAGFVGASVASGVALYTSAVDGMLDDAASAAGTAYAKIAGVEVVTTQGAANTVANVIATFPYAAI